MGSPSCPCHLPPLVVSGRLLLLPHGRLFLLLHERLGPFLLGPEVPVAGFLQDTIANDLPPCTKGALLVGTGCISYYLGVVLLRHRTPLSFVVLYFSLSSAAHPLLTTWGGA